MHPTVFYKQMFYFVLKKYLSINKCILNSNIDIYFTLIRIFHLCKITNVFCTQMYFSLESILHWNVFITQEYFHLDKLYFALKCILHSNVFCTFSAQEYFSPNLYFTLKSGYNALCRNEKGFANFKQNVPLYLISKNIKLPVL